MTRRGVASLLLGCVVVLGADRPGPAAAQSAVTASVGETADAATGVATGTTLSLDIATYGGPGGLALALGLPTDPDAGTRWGSAAAWADWPALTRWVGVAASAQGFAYRDPMLETDGGAGEARAELFRDLEGVGPVTLRLRAGGRGGLLSADSTTVRRALWGGGVDATLAGGAVALRVSGDLWAAEEDVYPGVAAAAVVALGVATLHGRVDRWLHDGLTDTGWSVGGEIPLFGRLSLIARAARPSTDILFFSPPQRSWSVGVRLGTGRPRPTAIPVPLFAEAGEVVRLEVTAPGDDGRIRVAGTFSDWEPLEMTRRGDRWVIDLRLDPGVHEYTFVDGSGRWFVPEGTAGRKPDGYGGFVGTVVVR